MKITPSAAGIKYFKKVKLPNGGLIEMIEEISRPKKGKGSQQAISAIKRIYRLTAVPVPLDRLKQLTVQRGETNFFSGSKGTGLKIIRKEPDQVIVAGKASYQGLTLLGLNKHVQIELATGKKLLSGKIEPESMAKKIAEKKGEIIALGFPNSETLLGFIKKNNRFLILDENFISTGSYDIGKIIGNPQIFLFAKKEDYEKVIRNLL